MDKRHQNKGTGKKAVPDSKVELDLSSIDSAVKSLADTVEQFAAGTIHLQTRSFSRLVWAVMTVINCMKTAKADDLEDRLAALEEKAGLRVISNAKKVSGLEEAT